MLALALGSGSIMVDYGDFFTVLTMQGKILQHRTRKDFHIGFASAFRTEDKPFFVCGHFSSLQELSLLRCKPLAPSHYRGDTKTIVMQGMPAPVGFEPTHPFPGLPV